MSKEANQRLRGAVQLAELCVEDEPEQAKNLMVTRFPTIVALKLGTGSKFVVAGSRNGVMSLEELTGWIEGLGLVESPSESTTTDPQLVKTSLFTASTTAPPAASPQYPTPPAPVKMIPVMPPSRLRRPRLRRRSNAKFTSSNRRNAKSSSSARSLPNRLPREK